MAGTAVFQSTTLATPGAGIVVHTDNINGTVAQIIKVDVGPAGTTVPVSYASGTGLPVQGVGTFQMLGTVRTVVGAATGENFFGTLFTGGVTNGTLVPAPAAGTYVRVFDMMVSGSAAGTAFVEFGDGTAFVPGVFAANGGFVFNSARGVRTHGTAQDILFNAAAGTWGVSVNYSLEN